MFRDFLTSSYKIPYFSSLNKLAEIYFQMHSGFSFNSGSGKDGPLTTVNKRNSDFSKLLKIIYKII